MKDAQGHDWQVDQTDHPFLTGWKCQNCARKTFTHDGWIPADEPKSPEPCVPGVLNP